MPLKKNLTIDDFHIVQYITDDEMLRVLGKRRYKRFHEFMIGQTCPIDTSGNCAYYPWDVENFLRPEDKRFFD